MLVSKLHFLLQTTETLCLAVKKLYSQVNSISEGIYHPNKEENVEILYGSNVCHFPNCMLLVRMHKYMIIVINNIVKKNL